MVLFQQLHYYDAATIIHKLTNGQAILSGGLLGSSIQSVSDAWYVHVLEVPNC
jgi:hypothetical protein